MRRKAASAAQSLLALLRAMNVDKYAVLPIHLMSTAFKQSATRYSATYAMPIYFDIITQVRIVISVCGNKNTAVLPTITCADDRLFK